MEISRNDTCHCGSNKKYKNCCGSNQFNPKNERKIVRRAVSLALVSLLFFLAWGILEHFTTERPEMEAYKCDNPNCGQIHYRLKTDTE